MYNSCSREFNFEQSWFILETYKGGWKDIGVDWELELVKWGTFVDDENLDRDSGGWEAEFEGWDDEEGLKTGWVSEYFWTIKWRTQPVSSSRS